MNTESIRKLYAYNRWANERTLTSVDGLSNEELNRQFAVSFGSLQATLAHIIGVEWLYIERWCGVSPQTIPGTDKYPDVPSLRQFWKAIVSAQDNFLAKLTDDALQQRYTYINLAGEPYGYALQDMMQHMVNHSTYHRGQVVYLLRMLGRQPQSTDYLRYLDETSDTRA